MKPSRFREERWLDWEDLEQDLDQGAGSEDFPARTRRVARDLALARHRAYGVGLVDHLNDLALRAHGRLHTRPPGRVRDLAELLFGRFPEAVRREWALCALSAALLWGPMLVMAEVVERSPEVALTVVDASTLAAFEEMYGTWGSAELDERGFLGDLTMFGFYIWNNVGIAFRCFASGAAFAVPAVVVLLYNGLFMGTIEGHLAQAGLGTQVGTFTASHGPFELTGIVLAAAGGLRLGISLAAPGRRSRGAALRQAAQGVAPMLWGAATLISLAAVIEAFWSSSQWVPALAKHTLGAVCWVILVAWLALGVRRAR